MKLKKRLLILAVLLVCGSIAGTWLYTRKQTDYENELVLYGNIDIREVNMAFNAVERIVSMLMVEGQRVKTGQLLATLESRRLIAHVARAEAQVSAQEQVVARMMAGSRLQEIQKARAEVEAAKAEVVNAKANYHRQLDLAKKKLASPQQRDDAGTAAQVAHAQLNAAKEALQLIVAGPRKEDIAAAEATLEAYKADLTIAQRNLADASLYAPNNGVIQNRIMEPGDMASPQTPVYSLALTDPVWVRAYLEESDLGKIYSGMPAQVSTDSYPGKTYPAWVGFISSTAEFTPKSVETTRVRTDLVYQLRIYVCNPQGELRLGMPATVILSLNQASSAVSTGLQSCDADAPQ